MSAALEPSGHGPEELASDWRMRYVRVGGRTSEVDVLDVPVVCGERVDALISRAIQCVDECHRKVHRVDPTHSRLVGQAIENGELREPRLISGIPPCVGL